MWSPQHRIPTQPLCLTGSRESRVHCTLAPIALHFPVKPAGSLQAPRAVFPALRAVVAFLARETGATTKLAFGKSKPRHPGDWP